MSWIRLQNMPDDPEKTRGDGCQPKNKIIGRELQNIQYMLLSTMFPMREVIYWTDSESSAQTCEWTQRLLQGSPEADSPNLYERNRQE